MADADRMDACDFVPTEEQAALVGAPERTGKIGNQGTNTIEVTNEFVARALPKRKYVKDGLSARLFSDSRTTLVHSRYRGSCNPR
jgi:hypothetical protein